MKTKKILAVLLLLAIFIPTLATGALAFRGAGVEVMSKDVCVVKAGLLGRKLTFSDADFKSAFAISDFEKITVTALPSSNEGTLLLAGRRISEGQSVKRRNIAAMVFVPASKEVTEASFSFTVDGGRESVCRMRFTDKINYAPELGGAGDASAYISTQADISVYGRMSATDKEGDSIEYMIVAYPKSGTLSVINEELGTYKYTPKASFTGYDSFVYVARDEWGNYSEPCEVSLKVVERMSDIVYRDMTDRTEYNAAVAMSAMGVMSGRQLGDDFYFRPDEAVSRAEFVAMALKSYGIRPDSTVGESYFDDNDEISPSLVGYVATAARLGVIDGEYEDGRLTFSPSKAISIYEAADIMSRLIGTTDGEDSAYSEMTGVPVWARSGVAAMVVLGVIDSDAQDLTCAVTRADAAEFLYRMVNNS